jgi:hypothetical protein
MLLYRLPVELTGVQQSLMPLHSVTASALFASLLSVQNNNWGCLSEGIGCLKLLQYHFMLCCQTSMQLPLFLIT